MKLYQSAMEHCAPPEGLEAQLRQKVLAVQPPEKCHVFRPRGFVRKAVLAAVIATLLTVTAGAAALLHWDDVFSARFGADAADTPMAQAAFQDVSVTSVCDDVTLTVRQALSSDDTTCLVLDYQLPDTVDREWLQAQFTKEETLVYLSGTFFFATGEITWEDFREADQAIWETLDWTDPISCANYLVTGGALRNDRFASGGSMQAVNQGYDPETNTVTYLLSFTIRSETQTMDSQPLTLLVGPLVVQEDDGTAVALTDHPAILTFQPEYISQTLTGTWEDTEGGQSLNVTLSPFAIQVESHLGTFAGPGDLRGSTALVFRDGTVTPVAELTQGLTGSSSGKKPYPASVDFSSSFLQLVDVSQVEAVQVGDTVIPLA